MKHTQEEIINALQILQDTCSENEVCKTCPLRSTKYGCNLTKGAPTLWKIKNNELWRAFE